MSKSRIIFISGGQRSGKSVFSEKLALSLSSHPVYIATAKIEDDETLRRVEIHRKRRGDRWSTIEAPFIQDADLSGETVLFDCLTMFATNHFLENDTDVETTICAVKTQLERLFSNHGATIIVVSNEIGFGGISSNSMQRRFTDVQGTLNQWVASQAAEAYLVVSGLPLRLK